MPTLTINEAIKIVEDRLKLEGLSLQRIDRMELIRLAENMVKAQGDDPLNEVIPFPWH